jgi:hypothetical protein
VLVKQLTGEPGPDREASVSGELRYPAFPLSGDQMRREQRRAMDDRAHGYAGLRKPDPPHFPGGVHILRFINPPALAAKRKIPEGVQGEAEPPPALAMEEEESAVWQ